MRSATLWRIDAGLLAVHAVGAATAWLAMPRRVPTHFTLAGTPDAWSRTTVASWFGLLVTSIALSWLIHALSHAVSLESWNIPDKERLLQLPREEQEPVIELVHGYAAASAITTTVIFLALQVGVYLIATQDAHGPPWFVSVVMYGALATLLIGTVCWSRLLRRTLRRVAH